MMMLDLVASPTKLRLLRFLRTSGGAHTGRQIARAVGMDPKSAALALRELTEAGLVVRRQAGRAYMHSLNTEHYLISDVLGRVLDSERDWLQAVAADVREAAGAQVETIVLYGSHARGEAGSRSDVDLLIVVESRTKPEGVTERLNGHRLKIEQRYGHRLSFLVMTRRDLRDKVKKGDRLVLDIMAQGRVLTGKSLTDLMGHG